MAVVLSGKVDLFIYRAWYEGCDFVKPKFYRKVILPRLKNDAALAHEHGALSLVTFARAASCRVSTIIWQPELTSSSGLIPCKGTKTDMAAIKKENRRAHCLWGGVSGAVTVEMGERGRSSCRCPARHRNPGAGGFHTFAGR